jgi:hypothetical protein
VVDMLPWHHGLEKYDQQLIERWWIHGVVVAMVIGIVIPSFAIRRVGVDEIEKKG